MNRVSLAVVGYGRLGRACVTALAETEDLALAGIVLRHAADSGATGAKAAMVEHVRDLPPVQAALVCVPVAVATGVVRELLQERIAVVECAMFEGHARQRHYEAIAEVAKHRRVAAVVGAGWNPGVLPLILKTFEILVPKGHTVTSTSPGLRVHHTEALAEVRGVKGALATELRGADGNIERYIYVQLDDPTALESVRAALAIDPLYGGAHTQVFAVDSIAALEAEGAGIVAERRGTSRSGAHQSVLFEARFDPVTFAARVMLDAARRLPALGPGLHHYTPRA